MSSSQMLLKLSGRLWGALSPSDRRIGLDRPSEGGKVTSEQLYLRARALSRIGDKALIIDILKQAHSLDPQFSDALEAQGEALDLSGDSHAAVGRYELARSIRRTARRGTPDRHYVWRQLRPSTAEVLAYGSVIKSLRKHALPYLARGNAYLVGGRPQEAIADYDRAFGLLGPSPEVLALKGEALVGMGRYDEAAELFDTVLAARPSDFDALNSRGIARMALGRVIDANDDWKRQREIMKGRPAANAYSALRMADYEATLACLEQVPHRDKKDPYWSLYVLSMSLRLRRGQPEVSARADDGWPGLLVAYLQGNATADEVLALADTPSRQGEAQFQFGVLASVRDPAVARRCWQCVVDVCPPTLVEYAAARNELARLGS